MVLFAAIPFMVACSSDDEDGENEYYVKYEVTNGIMRYDIKKMYRSIEYQDVGKTGHYNITSLYDKIEWEGTFGPFKKGDKVFLNVTSDGRFTTNARISISKNREAFTIKKESNNATHISLKYTIDY
jgi:hypothetical protein